MSAEQQLSTDVALTLVSYGYILLMILISDRTEKAFKWSRRASRKLLHILIGNFPFIIPFFSESIFPVIIASSFILVTFLATPYSPLKGVSQKLMGLQDTTSEGHTLGLVFYAISYTILAAAFFKSPYVIAAGILSMAYGDSIGSLIGQRYGKRKYKLFAQKTIEGSMAVFLGSITSVICGLSFYALFHPFTLSEIILLSTGVALVATIVEGISPSGLDNLTVPISCALFVFFMRV
jgi:phytol kinase